MNDSFQAADPRRLEVGDSLADIARLEERRLAIGVAEVAPVSEPFAGGSMCRAAAGSWTNAVFGAGFAGPVEPAAITSMIAWYRAAGIEPRIELCPFADPTLIRGLADERFVIRTFEQVFYRSLADAASITAPFPAPRGLRIEVVPPTDEALVELYARTAIAGFLPEGEPIPEALLESSRAVARHGRTTPMIAWIGNEAVGAGAVEANGEIAALFGVSVVPAFRRQGIQQALFVWRLHHAAQRGARFATIGGLPGAGTERNARRFGFRVAYTKVILVRPEAGLAPVIG